MKIRKVGHSNVVSIPREHESLGFAADVPVLITALPSGELRVLPASRLRQMIRDYGRRVIAEDRAALQILEDHDKSEA